MIGLALAVLAGCASREAPKPPLVFDRIEAAKLFAAGFSGIQKFHINRNSLSGMVVDGLNGLRAIDRRLTARRDGGTVILVYGNRLLAEFAAPARGDVAGWSRLLSNAVATGREASAALGRTEREALYTAVFAGSLRPLDRYTRYADPRAARRARAHRQGYIGIGIAFRSGPQGVVITEVFEGAPADQAGLRVGDILLSVENHPVSGLDGEDIARRLRSGLGASVGLLVRRGAVLEWFRVRRAEIVKQTVEYRRIGRIGEVRISGFNSDTAPRMRQTLHRARAQSVTGLILDLRGNRGGTFRDAVAIADMFMAEGTILSTHGRHPDARGSFTARPDDLSGGLPVVVLIDRHSASAAEILAAALQDSGRGLLLGARTYGKGSVQTVVDLPNEAELYVTWTRMYAPSGYPLSRFGVFPAICTADIAPAQPPYTVAPEILAAGAELLRQRRHVHHLPAAARRQLLRRCGERIGGGRDLERDLALRLLTDPGLLHLAFRPTMAFGSAVAR